VLQLGGIKQRSLLALLLLHRNQVVSTDRLVDAVWAGAPPPTARQSIHNFVASLRRTLGHASSGRPEPEPHRPAPPILRTCPPGYQLDVRSGELDLDRFRQMVASARRALDGGDASAAACGLRVALGLWRGPFLADLADAGVEWVRRPELAEERLAALELRVDADLVRGRHEQIVAELEALVTAHPLRERLAGQLILALYRCGRQADALATYRATRAAIVDQLGVEPGRQLQEVHQAILAHDPSVGLPVPARVAPARDERRPVTVVLAAVDGCVAGVDRDDPEDVRRSLAAGLNVVRDQVERAGGTVQHVLGSTAMALFGVPRAREDDAERAVRAALAIRDGAPAVARPVRVAVATGQALLTSHPNPGEPALSGHVVSAGTGLLEVAPAGRVLATPATARATQRSVAYRPVELTPIAGRDPPDAFEAVRIREHEGQDAVAVLPDDPATTWRGREEELALLAAHFDRACHGDPQLVTVVGDAGSGKSRLIAEFGAALQRQASGSEAVGHACRGSAVTWRTGRTLSYGTSMPFWALADVVKRHLGIMETDPAGVADRKLDQGLRAAVTDADQRAWVRRHLRALIGDDASGPDPSARQDEALAAWSRFLQGLAGDAPLVLVFEDLHWADDALLDFIAALPERLGDAPVLVVATARPELLDRRPAWGVGHPAGTVQRLARLSDMTMKALVGGLIARHRLPAGLTATLVEQVGGNPLFAEEYVRMLADLGRGGLPEGGLPGGGLPLPESVHTIIAARLDRLREEDRRVLEDAAVVGRVAWSGAIAAVGGYDDGARLAECLRRLERRELVRRLPGSRVAGQDEYSFSHVLIRDVAYSRISRAARADKHRRAAAWMEALAGHRMADRAELLAHHYELALEAARGSGQPVDAIERPASLALRAAGDRAAGLGAYGAAARWYAEALDLCPVTDAQRPELLFRLGSAHFFQDGDGEQTLRLARDALLAAGDRGRAAEAQMMLGLLAWRRGDNDRPIMRNALELIDGAGEPRSKAFVLSRCALRFVIDDQPDLALETGREALRLADELGLVADAAKASTAIGMARIAGGEADGLLDLRRAANALEHANSTAASNALINYATQLARLGDLRACFAAQRRARQVAERFALAAELRWLEAERVLELYWTGDEPSAAARAQRFILASAEGEPHYLEPSCRVVRGRYLLARGRRAAAATDAEHALSLARTADDAQLLAPALAFRARVLVALGDRSEAADLIDEALATMRGRMLLPEIGVDLAIVLMAIRSRSALAALAALEGAGITPSVWFEATRAYIGGDRARAAAMFARIGSVPDARAAGARRSPATHAAKAVRRRRSERVPAPPLAAG
jgi:DNA-binding SARP family transcriptional activator/tetratricopeptide (TPR) repeat protein